MRRIVPHEELCMGCTLCQVYCVLTHSQSSDIIKAYKRELITPRIRVNRDESVAVAIQCHNCKNPPCVEACLTGAMHVDEKSGNIIHDDKICIGCFTCVMVCPFGAIITDFSGSKTPLKCDLCPSLETPACVANCPNEALVLEEVAE